MHPIIAQFYERHMASATYLQWSGKSSAFITSIWLMLFSIFWNMNSFIT